MAQRDALNSRTSGNGAGVLGRENREEGLEVNDKVEKLNNDIKTLLEKIRVDWLDIAHLPLSAADRASIRAHIEHAGSELTDILHRLNRAEKADDGLPAGHRHA
jgi:hypothetical protein